jgi:virginiamycin B lyase
MKKRTVYAAITVIIVFLVFAVYWGLFRPNNNSGPVDTSSNVELASRSKADSIARFQQLFCGQYTKPNSNEFIVEYTLPGRCEMPLGIALDGNVTNVWYVSTKNGTLGSYNIKENKFDKEFTIPEWNARKSPIDSSQVWDVKIDQRGDVWFTDEKQNAIWRFINSSHEFEMYTIPEKSKSFGTTYPVAMDFDSMGNVYFVGIRSPSLWFADKAKLKNGTSEGISRIPIPIEKFKGMDPDLISTGSVAYDTKNNSVWVSMLSFQRKGEIFKYKIGDRNFESFDMPKELNSPVGITLDGLGNPWITDHGTSIFYKLDASTGNITKFSTSQVSSRIFGDTNKRPVGAYTLPYWIKVGENGELWFNEHVGNKIARFDPSNLTLVEYWIPSQNKLWGQCSFTSQSCGIANALQFSGGHNGQLWFTEWSENKIGRLNVNKQLPFLVSTTPEELNLTRGNSAEIKVLVQATSDVTVNMTAASTISSTGDISNSTGYFSEESSQIGAGKSKQISFIFTPSADVLPGEYTLMLGADNKVVSYLKAVKINIL